MNGESVDLAEFVLARIADDEQIARAASPAPWSGDTSIKGDCVVFDATGEWITNVGPGSITHRGAVAFDQDEPNTAHLARWDPARVLSESAAKRRVVHLAQASLDEPNSWFWPPRVHMTGMADGLVLAVQVLALPYADHPDYRSEWAP